jgi:hypothetical protein
MKLYSESTILKRLESLSISNPAIFFDGMNPEQELEQEPKQVETPIDDQSNFMLLDAVIKLVAAKVANYGHCDDDEMKDCFRLSNKIINLINNKNFINVQ